MNANATTSGDSSAHTEQQVSGASIFWALASLSLSAIVQPSADDQTLGADALYSAFWPQRSSPLFCLPETIRDVRLIVALTRHYFWRRRRDIPTPPRTPPAQATAWPKRATAQLLVLAMGVLPPALKLFNMSGVPRSQTLGVIFLAAALSSTIRSVLYGVVLQRLKAYGLLEGLIDDSSKPDQSPCSAGLMQYCFSLSGFASTNVLISMYSTGET